MTNADNDKRIGAMVEIRGEAGERPDEVLKRVAAWSVAGCTWTPDYEPVPLGDPSSESFTWIVHCQLDDEETLKTLERRSGVVAVWPEGKATGFDS